MTNPFAPPVRGAAGGPGGYADQVDAAIAFMQSSVRTPEYYGALGDGVNDTGALADMFAAGGLIVLSPDKNYRSTATIIPSAPIAFLGGVIDYPSTKPGQTRFTFAAGVTAFEIDNAIAEFVELAGFRLESESTGAGSDVGILVRANSSGIDRVIIAGFGSHGLAVDTSGGGNGNNSAIRRVRSEGNYGDGFHVGDGTDSNVVHLDKCSAVSNHGWGLYDKSQNLLTSGFHCDSNITGALYEDGINYDHQDFYVEGGVGATIEFGDHAAYGELHEGLVGTGITYVNETRAILQGSRHFRDGGCVRAIKIKGIGTLATDYVIQSGVYQNGWLSISIPEVGDILTVDGGLQRVQSLIRLDGSPQGINTKVKAGTPSDADFAHPVDGLIVVDSSANKIWTRLGGVWKWAALT